MKKAYFILLTVVIVVIVVIVVVVLIVLIVVHQLIPFFCVLLQVLIAPHGEMDKHAPLL